MLNCKRPVGPVLTTLSTRAALAFRAYRRILMMACLPVLFINLNTSRGFSWQILANIALGLSSRSNSVLNRQISMLLFALRHYYLWGIPKTLSFVLLSQYPATIVGLVRVSPVKVPVIFSSQIRVPVYRVYRPKLSSHTRPLLCEVTMFIPAIHVCKHASRPENPPGTVEELHVGAFVGILRRLFPRKGLPIAIHALR
jgi:hypothetical protein